VNRRLWVLRAAWAVIWPLSAAATLADRFRDWADWVCERHGEALIKARWGDRQ
jgi:hypothetical protein